MMCDNIQHLSEENSPTNSQNAGMQLMKIVQQTIDICVRRNKKIVGKGRNQMNIVSF